MVRDQIQWTAPAPLWANAADATDMIARRVKLQRPAILRFATDGFMDEFMAMLENDPIRLPELVAGPEAWWGAGGKPVSVKKAPFFARRVSRLGLVAARQKSAALLPASVGVRSSSTDVSAAGDNILQQRPLKLYQPAHQRYYLITACLVCGRPGLPDRAIDPGPAERATFVVRRLFPPGGPDMTKDLPPFDPDQWEEHAFVLGGNGNGWQRIPQSAGSTADVLISGKSNSRCLR